MRQNSWLRRSVVRNNDEIVNKTDEIRVEGNREKEVDQRRNG